MVLYNNQDEAAVSALADRLEDDPNVKSAMSYSTTLGRQCTAEQMANAIARSRPASRSAPICSA